MSNGLEHSHFALGSINRRRAPGHDDLFVGNSSFSNEELFVKLVAYPELMTMDSYIGPTPDDLTPLVHTRIQPGENVGLRPDQSVITMITWRAGENQPDWEREY